MGKRGRAAVIGVAVSVLVSLYGCLQDDAKPGALTGPSALGLSLALFANPDVLPFDGASQSQIVVEARDANGQPQPNVGFRVEICTTAGCFDFGQLSARTLVTGGDGRATVTYTAPLGLVESGGAVDPGIVVTILVTPSGTDFAGALARSVEIRLVPPTGVILPPNGAPVAAFTVSQPTVTGVRIRFDGSISTDPDGIIVSYDWTFGDGKSATGMVRNG